MTEHQDDQPDTDTVTGEVAVYTPAAASTPARLVDMRNPTTDSWTDIVEDVAYLAQRIVGTPMVPDALNSTPKIAAAMLRGRELGLPPMEALSSIFVIKGKAGISAEAMRGLILRAGHEYRIEEQTSSRCIMQGRRRGADEWSRFEYTMAEAERAGDTKTNANYRSRPVEMLLARCTTRMARAIFPDAIHGMSAAEELDADPAGETAEQTATPGAPTVRQQPVQRRPSRPAPRQIEQGASEQPADEQAEEQPATETAVQRRPSRPAPRGTTESPAPDPVPARGDEGEEGGGDETRTDPPPDPAPAREPREQPKKLNVGQRGQIMGHFTRLGIEDRDERLEWCRILTGRTEPVGSTNELLATEATEMLGKLERIRNRDALDALITDGGES